MKSIKLKRPTKQQCILLHDLYYEASEPDSPKKKFEFLSDLEKETAFDQYHPEDHLSVFENNNLIGFIGIVPDDKFVNVNIFYIILPLFRGKGYFSKILSVLIDYCEKNYYDYKYIRTLTLKNNIASIKGLEKSLFIRKGEYVEVTQPDMKYEEFVFELTE